MKTNKSEAWCWLWVVIYALGMAWVESATVFYLRSMIGRVDPYQPDPLPLVGGFASVELMREFATLVMLCAVGFLAGKNWRTRIGYAVIAFGIWDIFYYAFLKIICGWPHSLFDWDVLFLLPLPWWGPVIAPMLISLLMICWGTLTTQFEPAGASRKSGFLIWLLCFAGIAVALYVFMADAIAASKHGVDAIRATLPKHFKWHLFLVGLALMSVPALQLARELFTQRRLHPNEKAAAAIVTQTLQN
jgi:uncharacterized membrane protein YhaH (DUF805 family)